MQLDTVAKDGTLIGVILTLLGVIIMILKEWIKTRRDLKELHKEGLGAWQEFSNAYKELTERTLMAIYDNKEASNSIRSTILINKEVIDELKNSIDVLTQTIIQSIRKK